MEFPSQGGVSIMMDEKQVQFGQYVIITPPGGSLFPHVKAGPISGIRTCFPVDAKNR